MNAVHALDRLERNLKLVRLAAHRVERVRFNDAFGVARQNAKRHLGVRQLRERADFVF